MKDSKRYYDIRNEIANEVLTKYPTMKNRTMARLLHENYTEFFPSLEAARSLIRTRRGVNGELNRKYATI